MARSIQDRFREARAAARADDKRNVDMAVRAAAGGTDRSGVRTPQVQTGGAVPVGDAEAASIRERFKQAHEQAVLQDREPKGLSLPTLEDAVKGEERAARTAEANARRGVSASNTGGTSTTAQLMEQARQAAADLDTDTLNRINAQLKDRRAAVGKQTAGDRADDITTAILAGSGAGVTNTVGTVANAFNDPESKRRQIERLQKRLADGGYSDGKRFVRDTEEGRKTIRDSIRRLADEAWKLEQEDSFANKTHKLADRMQDDSAGAQERAKEGLGAVGSTLVDAGISTGQSMLDAGIGALTGTGMAPFVVRAFGGAAQEARRGGADLDQQLGYGTAQAAKEYITEKLFGLAVPQRISGSRSFGSVDDAIEKGIRSVTERLAKTPAGQQAIGGLLTWLAGGVTEGLEEGIGSVIENTLINPNLREWDPDTRTGQEKFEDALYDMLVGGVSGLMGVTNLMSYRPGAGATTTLENTDPQTAQGTAQEPAQGTLREGETQGSARAETPLEGLSLPKLEDIGGGQKETAPGMGAANENGLLALTEQEKVNLSSGKKNKIVSTFQEAVSFIKNALSDRQNVDRAYLGKVPEATAQKVLNETGVDIRGYNAILPGDAVRHMFKNHGDTAAEAERGQVALTPETAANITAVLSNPDKVIFSKQTDAYGRKTLMFEKKIGDIYITAQAVTDGTKSLTTDTLYIKKGSPTTVDEMQAPPGQTSETSSGPTLTETISQPAGEVNGGKIQQPGGLNDGEGAERTVSAEAGGREAGAPGRTGGDGVSDGSPERDGGMGAGEQAGRLGGGPVRGQKAVDPGAAAIKRQALGKTLRGQKVSSRSLGISSGTDAAVVTVIPESAWDEGLRSTAEKIERETGKRTTFVLGRIQVTGADGKVRNVRGVRMDGGIILQADNYKASVEQLADHEIFHDLAAEDPGIVRALEDRISETMGREELNRVIDAYMDALSGVYDYETATGEELEQAYLNILEEIYADAYAGINAFGVNAGQFSTAVEESLEDRGLGRRGQETVEATDRTTGPPSSRYSYGGKNADRADSESLAEAERLEKQGLDPEDIRQETGWFRGMDGKWRFEIDDSGMEYSRWGDMNRADRAEYARFRELEGKFIDGSLTAEEQTELRSLIDQGHGPGRAEEQGTLKLSDFIHHDELFRNYPQLRKIGLRFAELPMGVRGSFDGQDIALSESLRNAPEDVLIHEIQHAIQRAESFSRGATWEYWNRRLEEGYVPPQDRARTERIEAAMQTIREIEATAPEGFLSKLREYQYLENYIASDQGSADLDAWERAESVQAELEERYGSLFTKWFDADWERQMAEGSRSEVMPGDLYRNTAGEIEARDVAARRKLSPEERRRTAPNLGDENTVFAEGDGKSLSFAGKEIPTYEELIKKPDVQIVDIRGERSGRLSDQRKNFLSSETAKKLYAAPVVNKDTGEALFITPKTITHTFSNLGQDQVALAEHLPEVVREAVLTHGEPSRKAPGDKSTGVFTLLGAARTDEGVQPVKLTVKEYNIEGQDIPQTIKDYLGTGLQPQTYASVYDGKVLVLESIEKEEASSSATTDAAQSTAVNYPSASSSEEASSSAPSTASETDTAEKYPSASSTISVKDLLGFVKGDAERYVPKQGGEARYSVKEKSRLRQTEDPSPGTGRNTATNSKNSMRQQGQESKGENQELKGLSLPTQEEEKPGPRFSVDEDSRGRELTEGQAEYFKESKVRDAEGRLLTLYHQTEGDFTVFDPRHQGAGSRDNGTPFGIFLKTSDRDIGLRGKRQMELYANIVNPLRASDREDLVRQLQRISSEYASISDEIAYLDVEYHGKYEDAKKALRDFMTKWRSQNPDASRRTLYDVPEFNTLYEAEDLVLDEWTAKESELSTRAKEVITAALQNAGYDGVILSTDRGSWGRSTDAYIALSPSQVKNVTNTAPSKSPDIRFSADDAETKWANRPKTELEAVERELERLRDLDYQTELLRQGGAAAVRENETKVRRLEKRADRLRGAEQRKKERPAKKERPENKREPKKPVAESKPIIAKRELRKNLLGTFSIPEGQRAELGAVVDGVADKLLREGALTEEIRNDLFNRLYNSGVVTEAADEYFQEGRNAVAGGRIFVNDIIKGDFGDDWNAFRKRAMANGVYLTNDQSDAGVDVWNQELGETLPGLFNRDELDGRTILERIVQVAEEGRDQKVSLAEYTKQLAGEEYVSEREILDNMERQMDWALRTFAEKADLEIKLRDRTGVKIAQEREKFAESSRRQREREALRRGKEREQRRDMMRRQRENRELRELQQRTLKQLQWLSKNRYRAPEELRGTWDAVLGDIDIYAVGAANEMNWSKKYEATWRDLAQMYQEAKKSDPNFLPSKDLERIVARLDGDKIADMDVSALQDLYKAAVGLRTEFYNRNNVINDEQGRMFAEVYADSKREIEEAPESYTGKGLDKFVNLEQLTPMNVLERMGGWDPEGTFYSMAKQLEKGERDARAYTVEAKRQIEDFLTENQEWVKRADGQGKDAIWYELEVPELLKLGMGNKPVFGETVKVYMTPAQKVQLYLESKNHDNLRHIAKGGRTFVNRELYSRGERQEAMEKEKPIKLAPETVKKIVSDMTEEEMELARVLERYYNEFAAGKINKVSNAYLGYDKAISKNYVPIFTDDNYNGSEPGIYDLTAEGVGHMKSREGGTNPSYNISALDAFERHIDQTSRWIGLTIPVHNWNTLLKYRDSSGNSMRQVISTKWGGKAKKYIENLLTELQGGKVEEKSGAEKLADTVLSNYISSVFGANPSIVFKQAMSFPLAGTYLGWENVPNIAAALRTDDKLINTYTSELAYRLMGYATPETAQLKDNPSKLSENRFLKFTFGGGAITAMDGWTVKSMWRWAENAVRRENPELETGTQEQIEAGQSPFYQEVARRFEEAVSRSQPMYDVMHRSGAMRNSSGIARALTLFKTVPQQQYNMLRQTVAEAQRAKRIYGEKSQNYSEAKKKAGRTVQGVILAGLGIEAINFLNAMLKNGAKRYKDEDEDEMTWASFGKQFLQGFMADNMGMMIGGDLIAEVLGSAVTGDKWYGIETPGITQIQDILEEFLAGCKNIQKLVRDGYGVVKNGGDLKEYFRRHGADYMGALEEGLATVATYFGGAAYNNIKGYALGALRWMSPETETAFQDFLKTADKNGLAGLKGEALETRIYDILKNRTGDAEKETAKDLAVLYEAGYKTAVPSDTPESITVDGEARKLNAFQKQLYDSVWREAVGGTLDEVTASEAFREADQETQAKMLRELYGYAGELAKAEVFDDYSVSTGAEKAREALRSGLDMADYLAVKAAGGVDRYLKAVGQGTRPEDAAQAALAVSEIRDAAEDKTPNLVLYREALRKTRDEDEQMAALSLLMSEGEYAKLEAGVYRGITPEMYVTARESIAGIDENGSVNQDEAARAIGSMLGLTDEERGVLWQLQNKSWKPEKNPFSVKAGERIYKDLQDGGGTLEKPRRESGEELKELSLPSLN